MRTLFVEATCRFILPSFLKGANSSFTTLEVNSSLERTKSSEKLFKDGYKSYLLKFIKIAEKHGSVPIHISCYVMHCVPGEM